MGVEPPDDADEPTSLEDRESDFAWDVDDELAQRPIGGVLKERLSKDSLKKKTTLWALLGILSLPF